MNGPTPAEWTSLVSRVAGLEAKDQALSDQIGGLREDLRRIEARLYLIVSTGILMSSAGGAILNHLGG